MFWDTESEDTDCLVPVTVLKTEEQYVKVIYNGRMGLIKAGDVRHLTERAPAESSDDILLSETESAQIRLVDVDSFPAHKLPEVAGKRKLPPFFHQIEEAVDAGFHVPNGIIKHAIADYLLGALQRPNGITLATEIVKWAAERPSVVSQIPPLLADMPPEVCRAFSDKAADFLAKSETTPEPYTSLFKVALGFPPSGHLCKEGISSYQPYGIVGKQAHFHPSPVFPDDVVNCRLLIEKEKDAEGALAAFSVTPATADSGVLADEEGNNRMAAHHPRSTHSKAAPNKRHLVFVPSTEANISALCKALQSPIPLLIEGDTGTGKTVSVSAAAERMDMEVIRFNLSSGTTVQDLVGRMQITDNKLELSLQPFTEAFSRGSLLVLDECNLAQEEVLATLETALDTGLLVIPDPTNPARATQEIRRHPMFRLIITQNPCTGLFVGKRHRLSAAFLSRFFPMKLASFLPDEFIDIAKARLVGIMRGTDEIWQTVAKVLGRVHSAASKYVTQNKGVSGVETSLTVFTCRDIINAVKLVTFTPSGEVDVAELVEPVKRRIPASLWCMYGSRFLAAGPREEVWKIVCEICAEEGVECPAKPADSVARYLSGQTSGPNTPPDPFAKPLPAVGSVVWCADDDNVAAPRNPLIVTERVLHTWRLLDFVMNLGRPVLLVGKSGTGVSHMALGYAAYRTDRYYLSHVTSETITGMLVGQNVPAFEGKDVIKWVDGPVTEAMTQGKWLVLDDLAAASATVLERLNSVLEEDPELFIAERGGDNPKVVELNKSFRILATAEHSQLTSLSPAFANRFTVIVCGKSDADTHQSDMTLFAQNMLFARPDANFERRGPQLLVEGNIVQSTAEEGYTGALASLELTEKHEWEVEVEHCPGGEGIVVGVAVDTKQLDLGTDLTHSSKVWGYSSIGVLHISQEAPPAWSLSKPLNVKAEKFKAGDVIKVAVSPAEKEIGFFKNGANVGTLKLARSEEDAAKPLKPFVGLNAKARVHMKFATQDAPDTQVNECTEMCGSSLSRGTYGLYSVVRAIQCARKLANNRAVTANHLRKAFMLLEVGWRQSGRKASDGGGMRGKHSSLGAPSLRAAAVAILFTNEVSPSLAQLTQRVSACVGMSVPVLIVDDYHWDLKDSLFKVVEQVKATPQSTVTEWYGSLLPTCTRDEVTITRVAGPLRRALEGGTCFLIDGIAHLSSSMQAQLGPLLDTGVLSRPGEDLPVRCAPGFSVGGS